jgi:hypothetical protein
MSLRFLVSLFLLCLFSRDRLQMAEPRFPRFGGVSGTNSSQFMDLVSVTFVSGLMSDSYTAITSSSGVLTVTSGGTAVAKINLVGSGYTTLGFQLFQPRGTSPRPSRCWLAWPASSSPT